MRPEPPDPEGEARALTLLHRAAGPLGFVASTDSASHYGYVWARDGAIASLAAVVTLDDGLLDAAARTLDTLASSTGPHGEIPSNVGPAGDVSYGRIVGRVDAPLWYAIAAGRVAATLGDPAFGRRHGLVVARALDLVDAWELNGRGLVPVPLGGDWADEYVGTGYLLGVQLLRLLALRLGPLPDGAPGPDPARAARADALEARLVLDYWVDPAAGPGDEHYHPAAFRRIADEPAPGYWLAGFDASGYAQRFDALANVLALLVDLGGPERSATVRAHVARLSGHGLLPAFDPIIEPEDPAWALLRDNHRFEFRNHAGAYHNGGRWPWITGLWAAALADADPSGAAAVADALDAANALGSDGRPGGWSFHEYHDSRTGLPGGVSGTAWSAAGAVIAHRALAGRQPLR